MLSKKRDPFISCVRKPEYPETVAPFISCVRKPEYPETVAPSEGKRPAPTGPTLYLRNVDLPLADEDMEKEMFGEIKFIPKRLTTVREDGKVKNDIDLEIRAIRIKT